jgi:hypothetical protein
MRSVFLSHLFLCSLLFLSPSTFSQSYLWRQSYAENLSSNNDIGVIGQKCGTSKDAQFVLGEKGSEERFVVFFILFPLPFLFLFRFQFFFLLLSFLFEIRKSQLYLSSLLTHSLFLPSCELFSTPSLFALTPPTRVEASFVSPKCVSRKAFLLGTKRMSA